MKSSCILLGLCGLTLSHALPQLPKRATCSPTPPSASSLIGDDALAINQAIQDCGNNGIIYLAANTTWTIRNVIDLSPCQGCELAIDGTVKVDPTNANYWEGKSFFQIFNVSSATITSPSHTGILDAQNVGSTLIDPVTRPRLFSIDKNSQDIHISHLRIRDVYQLILSIHSSSSIHVSNMTVESGNPIDGFSIERSQHVYFSNNTLQTGYACVIVNHNVTDLLVKDTSCALQRENVYLPPTAIYIDYTYAGGAAGKLQYMRDILVEGLRVKGDDVYGVRIDAESLKWPTELEISNATFRDVEIEGKAKVAAVLQEWRGRLVVRGVVFDGWRGLEYNATSLKCKNVGACDIRQANWDVTL